MRRAVASILVALLLVHRPLVAQEEAADRPASLRTHLQLRVEPLLDMHFHLRAVATGEVAGEGWPGEAAAVEAARQVEALLAHPLGWSLVEGALAESDSAAAFADCAAALPEEFTLPGERTARVREAATRWADALREAEPGFLDGRWPARRRQLDAARGRLEAMIGGDLESQWIGRALEDLAMTDPGLDVPVYLVEHAPDPGGVTVRTRAGAACIVGAKQFEGTLLAEAALHEFLHALDHATAHQNTALTRIRTKLAEAGAEPAMRRDTPHTLIFAEAAALVRSLIDEAHVPYGEARGYYDKVGPAARVVAPWTAWTRREIDLNEAIERIVETAADDP